MAVEVETSEKRIHTVIIDGSSFTFIDSMALHAIPSVSISLHLKSASCLTSSPRSKTTFVVALLAGIRARELWFEHGQLPVDFKSPMAENSLARRLHRRKNTSTRSPRLPLCTIREVISYLGSLKFWPLVFNYPLLLCSASFLNHPFQSTPQSVYQLLLMSCTIK